jgi:UDP-N-acetylglucosamine 2-epimerase (non-hydrolysing)
MRDTIHVGLVVGARPNLVKAAALLKAFAPHPRIRTQFIHTGQHYDGLMSGVFLRDLGIPAPHCQLRVGSATHAVQTGRVMTRLEAWLTGRQIDRLMVVGDVNSTMAAAIVGAKLGIPVDHIEAGLRSGDRSMPEEINRIVTDSISSRFFASEPAGVENLVREGHPSARIHHVGNVMIDTLKRLLPRARARRAWKAHGLRPKEYALATLHRAGNVDLPARLDVLIRTLDTVAHKLPVLFPVHPRTRRRLRAARRFRRVRLLEPLGYLDFLSLLSQSRLVIADSGGIQDETTALGIPCLTTRDTTERPITVSLGTSTLVGTHPRILLRKVEEILDGRYKQGAIPPLWDGRAGERIARILLAS